jgi:hypothetical protein
MFNVVELLLLPPLSCHTGANRGSVLCDGREHASLPVVWMLLPFSTVLGRGGVLCCLLQMICPPIRACSGCY